MHKLKEQMDSATDPIEKYKLESILYAMGRDVQEGRQSSLQYLKYMYFLFKYEDKFEEAQDQVLSRREPPPRPHEMDLQYVNYDQEDVIFLKDVIQSRRKQFLSRAPWVGRFVLWLVWILYPASPILKLKLSLLDHIHPDEE
jgi:hypothetical protein